MTSNQPDLDHLAALAAAATPGPWHLTDSSAIVAPLTGDEIADVWEPTAASRNGEFIEAAREALPALVDEVRRLRAELAGERERALDALNRRIENSREVCADCGKPVPDGPCGVHSPDAVFQRACHEAARFRAQLDATARLAGRLETKLRELGTPATADAVSVTAEESHVVADDSDDPEHIDDCPGYEPAGPDTLAAWLHQRFGTRGRYGQDWDALSDDDRAYWEHQDAAVRRAVARGGFKTTPPAARSAAV